MIVLKSLKLQILFSVFLTLFSINVSGQYLRNYIISADVNAGFLEQKTNFGYQFCIKNFASVNQKDRWNQLFLGFEVGETRNRYSFIEGITFFNGGHFKMYANGVHFSFLLTKVIAKPKKNDRKGYRFNYITFKCVINKFNKVKSYPAYDPYYPVDDNHPPIHGWITNPKTKSVNLELHFSKHIKINSFNYFKVGVYGGLRIGNTTGIEHTIIGSQIETRSKFSNPLKPLILGVSIGYQINLGKQKNK